MICSNQLFRLACGICSRIRSRKQLGQLRALKSQQRNFSSNKFLPILLHSDDGTSYSTTQQHVFSKQYGTFRCLHTTALQNSLHVWPYKITSRIAAEHLVREMNDKEKERLFSVLQDLNEERQLEQGLTEPLPNFNQMWMRMLHYFLFVCFLYFLEHYVSC